MRRFVPILALLLLTPLAPFAAAGSATPAQALGPDANGGWSLLYDVMRESAGQATASLDVTAEGLHATRDLGTLDLPAGATRLSFAFLPAEGPGDYAVSLVLDGAASAPLSFHVEGSDGGSATLAFDVPDEPTYLNLTGDSVNADGKLKAPGDDVITRGTLHDGNGLADLDPALRFTVEGPGYHAEGALPLPATPNATDVSLEHRWHDSPLPNATFRLTLSATRHGIALANLTRTFVVKDVAPALAPIALANVTPDADLTIPVDVLLADRNGAPGAGTLEAKLFRGSAAATGLTATFANGASLVDLAQGAPRGVTSEGAGLTAYPLTLRVPAGAAPGPVRLSLVLNGATLGSATLNLSALPTLAALNATQQGGALAFDANGTGDGILRLRLGNAAQDVPFVGGAAHASLAPPSDAASLPWNATLLARADGPALAWREGVWTRATPNLTLAPAHGLPRLPATWSLAAPGWDLAGASGNVTVLRWDGALEPNLTARVEGGNVTVEGPPTLAPGRYTLALRVTFANGTVGTVNTTFDAGPWVRVGLGAPVLAGRQASLALANAGGLAVRRVVVETRDNLTVSLVVNGTTLAPRVASPGRLVFDVTLAPGDQATLVARLPDGPLPSGTRATALRVLALPGAS
ncbi:MAG: hypothetical protein QOE90_3311 [Thermoplasmata archaeon]|jgi:hypothetical protein|nr:hypothetical protein [Thermoplasmata archaeon]